MRKSTGWKLAIIFLAVTLNPMSAYAGTWKNTSTGCQYQKDDGNYARAEWITENGTSYYLNQNGIMAVNTIPSGSRRQLGDRTAVAWRLCPNPV